MTPAVGFVLRRNAAVAAALAFWFVSTLPANGQLFQGAVGGVHIDANGVLMNAEVDQLNELRALRTRASQEVPGELNQPSELRKVSLRRLSAEIERCLDDGSTLPDEVLYLAGLQNVRYVLVYPEQNDIVLAGYGEGWRVGDHGEVIGVSTGRPVLLLDDLIVALRSAQAAAQGGIRCSIDPTTEGLARLNAALKSVGNVGDDPRPLLSGVEQTLGPQTITVAGVPETSHFARVLVAADYRMKRIAMNLESSPVAGLPGFLSMMKSGRGGMRSMMPRWWLSTNYEPLLTDEDRLTWELRGPGVKAMTESEFIAANGDRERTGKADPLAQRWADLMTEKYDELAVAEPVFGQLRNCMDLAIVAALVVKENLVERGGCELGMLADAGKLPAGQCAAAHSVASQASAVRSGKNWVISASGGVQIDLYGVASNVETSADLAPVRKAAAAVVENWWWN